MLSGRSRAPLWFIDRAMYPTHRLLGVRMARRLARLAFEPARAACGLPPADPMLRAAGRRVLVNTAFGLEYERPCRPEIHLVGPMLDDDEPVLAAELDTWLSAGPPVLFVNLGTLAAPATASVTALTCGIDDAPFRTLWVLRCEAGDIARRLSPVLCLESWVSSQIAVLRHPNTRAFLSHCGVDSVREAVICGVRSLVFPCSQISRTWQCVGSMPAWRSSCRSMPSRQMLSERRFAEPPRSRRFVVRCRGCRRRCGWREASRALPILSRMPRAVFGHANFAHPWSRCHAEV
jgi:hypothetical protein